MHGQQNIKLSKNPKDVNAWISLFIKCINTIIPRRPKDEVGGTCTTDGTGTAGHKSGRGQLRLSHCQLSQKDYFPYS